MVAIFLIVAVWLAYLFVGPTKIELEKIPSPDGRWTVVVTEYIFQVSTATPIKEINIRRSMGDFVSPFSSILLTFDQGNEEETVRIEWKDSNNLLVSLPSSAHLSMNPTIEMDNVKIRYLKN
jgi:hypothetical protein